MVELSLIDNIKVCSHVKARPVLSDSWAVDVKTQNVLGASLARSSVEHVNIYTRGVVSQPGFPRRLLLSSSYLPFGSLLHMAQFAAPLLRRRWLLLFLIRLPVAAEELCGER